MTFLSEKMGRRPEGQAVLISGGHCLMRMMRLFAIRSAPLCAPRKLEAPPWMTTVVIGHQATELDSHANMAVADCDYTVIARSGSFAKVTLFHNDLPVMEMVEIGDAKDCI